MRAATIWRFKSSSHQGPPRGSKIRNATVLSQTSRSAAQYRNAIMIRIAAFAIAGLLAIAAAPARADDGQTTTKTLKIATTDLRSPAAQADLRHRVHLAARAVCGPVEAFNAPDYASYAQCMTSAEHNALRHVDALVAKAGANAQFAAR